MFKSIVKPLPPINTSVAVVLLLALATLVRLPFLQAFDLVSYDGTYYINQARALAAGRWGEGGAFPPGYPAFIALLRWIIVDDVRAAQAVSVGACVASIPLFYALARKWLTDVHALLATACLVATPLYVRYTMMTMSESLYILWLLAGMYFVAGDRRVLTGLSLGIAMLVRPEALGIVIALAAYRALRRQPIAMMLTAFAIVYVVNVVVSTAATERLVLLPKLHLFGSGAAEWRSLEFSTNAPPTGAPSGMLTHYLSRIPSELWELVRHLTPVAFVLMLFGMIKRPSYLLAAFVPFVVNPLFTARIEPRFVLPFLPLAILYALIGVEHVSGSRWRRRSVALLVAAAIVGIAVNRSQFTMPVSDGFAGAKAAGEQMQDRLTPGRRNIADRKPFLAFYAGGNYVEIPDDPYPAIMRFLEEENVGYLALQQGVTDFFRPQLSMLLYDYTTINGELRLRQEYMNTTGVMIYRHLADFTSAKWRPVTQSIDAVRNDDPAWSPDGARIAFSSTRTGGGDIYVAHLNPSGPDSIVQVVGGISRESQPAWSPDGRRLAYASTARGNSDLYVLDLATRDNVRLTSDDGIDLSPDWFPDGKRIAFSSNRSGAFEVWTYDLTTEAVSKISSGGPNLHPAISPDGRHIAWIETGRRLVIYDTELKREVVPNTPRAVTSQPAWSPGGHYLAVEASDWGSSDVYLVTASGRQALQLTKTSGATGAPHWHPVLNQLTVVSEVSGVREVCVIGDFDPHLQRLRNPIEIRTFVRPNLP